MPVKTWATNDVPTASDFNTQFRDQVISTCTSGTRPAGTTGQFIYETDTNFLYVYVGGWIQMGNAGQWASWTPVLTQSTAVTKTVTYARHFKSGRTVTCTWALAVTGTGTGSNAVTVSLPFTAASSAFGSAFIYDASASLWYPAVSILSSPTAIALGDTTAPSTGLFLGSTGTAFTAALASGDQVAGNTTYEATT
jgi:hypothetical protein